MKKIAAPTLNNLELFSSPEPNTGCWLWMRSVLNSGYGKWHSPSFRESLAHRVAYRIANGDIPKGILVCHKCDERTCVNPNHLFLGTHSDNTRDMWRKGRQYLHPGLRKKVSECKYGHEFTPENSIIRSNGIGKECRKCKYIRKAKYRSLKRGLK